VHPAYFQWRFGLIPERIWRGGKDIDNPFRKRAIFVVHGMGEHQFTETAATLRTGIENAVQAVEPEHWETQRDSPVDDWIVPVPFVFDGYWGAYGDFKKTHEELWKTLHPRERSFFSKVWERRVYGWWRTTFWLVPQGVKLIHRSHGWARTYYWMLVPMLWTAVALLNLRPKTRRIITHTLADVRNYLDPQGDTAHTIVTAIDLEVGRKFLKLLGLDWDLNDLADKDKLQINGSAHRFERVTWVAHSLGTVISYNTLGDILHRCEQKRGEDPHHAGAKRVEEALQAFITLGSPLDKIALLFSSSVLRKWPECYERGSKELAADGRPLDLWKGRKYFDSPERTKDREFWRNFFYTEDPVSGSLDSTRFRSSHVDESLVENIHTKGARVPALSHLAYWGDEEVLKQVLKHVFEPPLVKSRRRKTRSVSRQALALKLMSLLWLLLLAALLGGVAAWAYRWVQGLLSG